MTQVMERQTTETPAPLPQRRTSRGWVVALVLVACVPSVALVASTRGEAQAVSTEPSLIGQVNNMISCAVDTAGLRTALATVEGITPEQIASTVSLLTFGRC